MITYPYPWILILESSSLNPYPWKHRRRLHNLHPDEDGEAEEGDGGRREKRRQPDVDGVDASGTRQAPGFWS